MTRRIIGHFIIATAAAGLSLMSPLATPDGGGSGRAQAQFATPRPATPFPGTAAEGLVDAAGAMQIPRAYAGTYQFLGAWAVAADGAAGSKQLHTVFASPGAVETFRKDGRFADGTVLVKEVRAAVTAPMTTGTVSRAGALAGWFMMVKDSGGAYPASPLWGEGWGWSWFNADSPGKAKTIDFRTECLGCHIPAKDKDWLYLDGYPALAR